MNITQKKLEKSKGNLELFLDIKKWFSHLNIQEINQN